MPRSRVLATLTKNDSVSLSPEPRLNLKPVRQRPEQTQA